MQESTDKKQALLIFALLAWPFYFNDFYLIALSGRSLGLLWSLDVVFFFLIPTLTLIYLLRAKKLSLKELGLDKRPTIKTFILAIALALLGDYLLTDRLAPWLTFEIFNEMRLCSGYPIPTAEPLKTITILYAALTAGILEEIIFRGALISKLGAFTKNKFTIGLFCCLLFALIHWCGGPGKIIYTFIYAIIATLWYLRTGVLWGPIIMHIFFDILAFDF